MENSSSIILAAAPASIRWRPKQYILAGMAAILAASTVIIVTSIILRPAHIEFSVINASANSTSLAYYGKSGVLFCFTLAADNNRSHRAGVRYRDVVVNMQIERTGRQRRSVQARVVNITMPFNQPPGNSTYMAVEGFLETDLSNLYLDSPAHATWTLMIIALVRFKVGLVYTRLYGIRISCSPVDIFNTTNFPRTINCSNGHA